MCAPRDTTELVFKTWVPFLCLAAVYVTYLVRLLFIAAGREIQKADIPHNIPSLATPIKGMEGMQLPWNLSNSSNASSSHWGAHLKKVSTVFFPTCLPSG